MSILLGPIAVIRSDSSEYDIFEYEFNGAEGSNSVTIYDSTITSAKVDLNDLPLFGKYDFNESSVSINIPLYNENKIKITLMGQEGEKAKLLIENLEDKTIDFTVSKDIEDIEISYSSVSERLKNKGALELYPAMEVIDDVLKIVNPDILFVHCNPDVPIDVNNDEIVKTITWRIYKREPGSISKEGPFAGIRNYREMHRENLTHPIYKDDIIQISGMYFDNIIIFDSWAKSSREAAELSKWFEDFMFEYAGLLKEKGLSRLRYMGSDKEIQTEKWDNDLKNISQMWYLRTEKIIRRDYKKIKDIRFKIDVKQKL